MVEWWVNQHFEDQLCPWYQGTEFPGDKDRDGPQNIGLLAIQPPDMTTCPTIFYCNFVMTYSCNFCEIKKLRTEGTMQNYETYPHALPN